MHSLISFLRYIYHKHCRCYCMAYLTMLCSCLIAFSFHSFSLFVFSFLLLFVAITLFKNHVLLWFLNSAIASTIDCYLVTTFAFFMNCSIGITYNCSITSIISTVNTTLSVPLYAFSISFFALSRLSPFANFVTLSVLSV